MLRRVIAKKNHILFFIMVYNVILYLLIVIVTMTYEVMRQVVIMNPFDNISNQFCPMLHYNIKQIVPFATVYTVHCCGIFGRYCQYR